MPYPADQIDTVVVGAGPIGLLNAIGLLNKSPHRKIVLLEKNAEYTRHHVLQTDYAQLATYINACGEPVDPVLQELMLQVRRNKHIRTSEIERRLKARAIELGAEIIQKPVTSIQEDVFDAYPNASLILGADGTHSVVSKQVFGEDNIQKFPFDFVLQLRYEVQGDAERIELATLVKFMQSYGITCDEYVGKKDENGRTPITFQLMITKEQFDDLYPHATSKNPIRPFNNLSQNANLVPSIIMDRLRGYLGLRLRHYTPDTQIVDLSVAGISVNEAPATRAKEVYKRVNGRRVFLVGDAALGLSYFKGFNAGVESSARLLPIMLSDDPNEGLSYHTWFDQYYAPKKVKEVETFSTYNIRLIVSIFRGLNYLLGKTFFMLTDESERSVDLYLGYLDHFPKNDKSMIIIDPAQEIVPWNPYPHRQVAPNSVLAFTPRPDKYLKKIWKSLRDTVAPYKTSYHVFRDLLTPIRALYEVVAGTAEIIFATLIALVSGVVNVISPSEHRRWDSIKETTAIFGQRLAEGGSRILFGAVLAIISVILVLRMPLRAIVTLNQASLLIEENTGMRRLIEETREDTGPRSMENENALCVDIHRKYQKSMSRGQASKVDPTQEMAAFARCRPSNPATYKEYFRLFQTEFNQEAIPENNSNNQLVT